MEIDIIDLSAGEYQTLTPVQLSMVRLAQAQKNKLTEKAEEEKKQLDWMLIQNRWSRATVRSLRIQEIDARLDYDIEVLRENLIMQLAYEALGTEGNESGPYRYPQNPNYDLNYSQRFLVVRQY